MLRTRVLTAAVLGPLFVLGVFLLPAPYFSALVGLIVLLASFEWTRLSGYTGAATALTGAAVIVVVLAAAYGVRHVLSIPFLVTACVLWLWVAAAIFVRRRGELIKWPKPVQWAAGLWILVPPWLAVTLLQESRPAAALMCFLLVWVADSGAYFAGRRWGRRKLAPTFSPGKSLEGVAGGLASAATLAAGFGLYWGFDAPPLLALVLWSVVVVLVSVLGDLFESNWKRRADMKDSGDLLPGHGGVLDRIDSITAAAPFFALGWLWWFAHVPT